MIPLLRPRSIQNALKASSKDIVDAFLRIKEDAAEVDTVVVGRKAVNVYTALYFYTRNHPELGVKVKQVGGKIILYKVHSHDTTSPSANTEAQRTG